MKWIIIVKPLQIGVYFTVQMFWKFDEEGRLIIIIIITVSDINDSNFMEKFWFSSIPLALYNQQVSHTWHAAATRRFFLT